MNFTYCTSPNWLQYLPIQIRSLCYHNPGNHTFHLLTKPLTESEEYNLESLVASLGSELFIHYVSERFKVSGRFTEYTMFKLLIPKCVPEKTIYLDSDTLVVGNLDPLWKADVPLLGGVRDSGYTNRRKKAINLPIWYEYFNGGMFVMNNPEIIKRNLMEKWLTMSKRTWPCNEQDIINLTLNNEGTRLSHKFNSCVSTAIHSDPVIVHYAGIKDPWVDLLPQNKYWKAAKEQFS